jgi:hypothetical protein
MVKFRTAAVLLPTLVTEAEVPAAPVFTVPTVTVAAAPPGPDGPAGPTPPACASSDQAPPFPELVSGSAELLLTVAMYVEPPKDTASFAVYP